MAIDVGELRAILTLQDQFSAPIKKAGGEIEGLSGAFKATAAVAAGFGAAVAAVAATVVELGKRGAAVADVQGQFETLAGGAAAAQGVLEGLRAGVVGSISDFDLMATANKALGAGLIKTAADAETLSAGARLLAKRTGGDTSEAFNTLTQAMASGRTASLKQLGLFVDGGKAAEDYARSIGASVKDLSDAEKAQALAAATLKALNGELARTPADAADFGEIIDGAMASFRNFTDALAVAISQSPVILTAMKAMGDAMSGAFDGSKTELVKTLMGYVNQFAIFLVDLGLGAVVVGQVFATAWSGIQTIVLGTMTAIGAVGIGLADFGIQVANLAAHLPGAGEGARALKAGAEELRSALVGTTGALAEQTAEAARGVLGQSALHQTLDAVGGKLYGLKDAMKAAAGANVEVTSTAQAVTTATNDMGAAAERSAELAALAAEQRRRAAEEERIAGDEIKAWFAQYNLDMQMMQAEGLELQLLQEEEARQRQLEGLEQFKEKNIVAYSAMVGAVNAMYDQKTVKAVASYMAEQQAALQAGAITQAEFDKQAAKAEEAYQRMVDAGQTSWEQIRAAQAAANKGMDEDDKRRTQSALQQFDAIASSASSMLRSLFGKNKAAAIAAVIIDTAAAVAKTWAQLGFPAAIPGAAAAVAMGAAQIAAIKGQQGTGFNFGTPGTSFEDFGTGTLAVLHSKEAVVNQAQGHSLAAMVGSAVREARSGPGAVEGRLERLGAELTGLRDDMRLLLPIAMRDAMLQARGVA